MSFLHNFSKKVIGCKYNLGADLSEDSKEIDCFSLIYRYCLFRYRKEIPLKYLGKPLAKYINMYKEIPTMAMCYFVDYIDKNFREVSKPHRAVGDILVCEDKDEYTIGILYANNSLMIANSSFGVKTINMENLNISKVYRCPAR